MPESFGARLRQRREQQQIALASIADQTKIKLSHLEGLERDDLSHWPSGIFRRAFVRAYAHAIGLDPDVVVREFLEAHPEPVEEGAGQGGESSSLTAGPSTGLRYLVGTAIDSLSRLRPGTGPRRDSILPQPDVRAKVQEPESAISEPLFESGAPESTVSEPDIPDAELPLPEPLPQPIEAIEPEAIPIDLSAAAQWCTAAARVDELLDTPFLLQEAVRILDAVGLIVWVWNERASELAPVLAHGYSDRVLAQLPRVRRDADNATAAAFRSAQTCVVHGGHSASGAVVVPLMTPAGCSGVLAVELRHGTAEQDPVRAVATIFAAQLARLVPIAQPAEAADRRLA